MTWLDLVFFLTILTFLVMGARLGSVWTAACLGGGFLGAYGADAYSPTVAGMMGTFPGAHTLASLMLFIGGVLICLIPGWLVSRFSSIVFFGVMDSAFGIVTGIIAGFCALTIGLLVALPLFPNIESALAWKQSALLRPYYRVVKGLFGHTELRELTEGAATKMEKVSSDVKPLAKKAATDVKEATRKAVDALKK